MRTIQKWPVVVMLLPGLLALGSFPAAGQPKPAPVPVVVGKVVQQPLATRLK